MKNLFFILTVLFALSLSFQDIMASQNPIDDIIGCILINCNGNGNPPPPPDLPPPPAPIGMDSSFDVPSALEPVTVHRFRYDANKHSFSMIGDSRTDWGVGSDLQNEYKNPDGLDYTNPSLIFGLWHQHRLLGKHKTSCSGAGMGIHNVAQAGTTAQQWSECITLKTLRFVNNKNDILLECKRIFDPMSNRVVVMIGGNDVLNRRKEYEFTNPFPAAGDQLRHVTTSDIHSYVKKIVVTLVLTGHEVMIQRHFMTNPNNHMLSADDGVRDLSAYAWRDFGGADDVIFTPPKLYIDRWINKILLIPVIGWCPVCLTNVHFHYKAPVWKWTNPKWEYHPKMPGVIFVHIREHFASEYFWDEKHLNALGGQLHANDLSYELNGRCWW